MLHVHRAERADGLVAALRELLAQPLGDPFAPEVVAVPTRGMERWLTQQLSTGLGARAGRHDGVCANVDFPSPHVLLRDAVATASGIAPEDDRWTPERLAWPLLETVEEDLGEPYLEALAAHLGAAGEDPTRSARGDDPARSARGDDPARRARRLSTVRHLAGLYDRYALLRPELLQAWAAGADGPIPPEGAWQASLWRQVAERIGQPGPAERLETARRAMTADPTLLDLPPRLGLFGLTRLPATQLSVLRAIASHRDVHLFLLHPSPALWEKVAAVAQPIVLRADDPTVTLPANRILASWGHDARELQLVLGDDETDDHHHPVEHRGDGLLARIQADVRHDRPPAETAAASAEHDPPDRSIEIHACHGRARQVEVLRDAILHLLADDPTLQPRDVIVMCPDIETFAPLIQATFGAGQTAGDDARDALPAEVRPPDLRVRLADRSLRQTNPLLGVVAQLLDLAPGRLTASEVLDLADREPVRRRFGLDDDDLARIEEWVRDSGIRWGLDAEHRTPFKLATIGAGTWRAGLDRVLLGVTMTEERHALVGNVLPLDDVDSGAIDLAGRFAEFADRLHTAVDRLARPQPIGDWTAALADAADALATPDPREDWQRAELGRVLAAVADEADRARADTSLPLSLQEVRALLANRLQGRPTRANFRTGNLTICTLVPMRSVPHRVVCLLGLDDDVFPRKAPRDGDDVTLHDPHVGERDARTEDRQLLLDALLAATDRLVITYTGNDERTNAVRPPAVPVGELLDTIERTAGPAARRQVVVRHPLQPFDRRNFAAGTLVGETSWGFDPVTLDGARALDRDRPPPAPFLAAPLPPDPSPLIELDDLVRFAERPVRAFLRQRLGVSVADYSDEVEDGLPVELDGLERWGVGNRLLQALLAGVDRRTAYRAEIARGTLPPGVLGQPVIEDVLPEAEEIVAWAERLIGPAGDVGSLDVRVPLADGRLVSGTVRGVTGDLVRTVTYSRVNPRQRLAAWVRLLLLTAAYPERPFEAATVGRARRRGKRVTLARLPRLSAEEARAQLGVLIDLYDRGMREPLPLYSETSAAYAEAAFRGGNPRVAAEKKWASAKWDNEDREPEHVLVLGGERTFTELLEDAPGADEAWGEEASRVGAYARRLWDPLLAIETLEDR